MAVGERGQRGEVCVCRPALAVASCDDYVADGDPRGPFAERRGERWQPVDDKRVDARVVVRERLPEPRRRAVLARLLVALVFAGAVVINGGGQDISRGDH